MKLNAAGLDNLEYELWPQSAYDQLLSHPNLVQWYDDSSFVDGLFQSFLSANIKIIGEPRMERYVDHDLRGVTSLITSESMQDMLLQPDKKELLVEVYPKMITASILLHFIYVRCDYLYVNKRQGDFLNNIEVSKMWEIFSLITQYLNSEFGTKCNVEFKKIWDISGYHIKTLVSYISRIYFNSVKNANHHWWATKIDASFEVVDNYAILNISDNGKGIDWDMLWSELGYSNQPLFRSWKTSWDGSGIGLDWLDVLVDSWIEIEATNKEEWWANICIRIPLNNNQWEVIDGVWEAMVRALDSEQ